MKSSDGTPRRRILEERHFHQLQLELTEKLRRRAAEEAARQALAESSGVTDHEIIEDLMALGCTPDTLMLLHLAPLVQVAWADGGVSESERALILDAARRRGVTPNSAAAKRLEEWLSRRPADEVFDKILRAITAMLNARPQAEREAGEQDLLTCCAAVAEVSGGILGFGRVSHDERKALERITREFERDHRTVVQRTIELFATS